MKFPTQKLLEVIRENREKHATDVKKAVQEYRRLAVLEFQKAIENANGGKPFAASLTLKEPIDKTKEYDAIISMLEMTSEQEVQLTQSEYREYILDEWSWKGPADLINSRYLMR